METFLEEYGIDYRWEDDDVICWIPFDLIEEFTKLASIKIEDGFKVNLQENGIALDMKDICEKNELDIETLFPKSVVK